MKTLAALLFALLIATPSLVAADSFGIEPTRGQLLSRIAALQSILSGTSISCAVATTKSTVRVGESFTIAWGSFGADAKYSTDPQNAYTQNGEQTMLINAPESRKYSFTFFGPNGSKVTCDQTISVLSR